jgi:hypothetical protein
MSPAPRDRVIEALTSDDGIWLRVEWRHGVFVGVDIRGAWLMAGEIEIWRETSQAATGTRQAEPDL